MTIDPDNFASLDASIARGLADAEAGRTKSAEEIFDRLEAKYRELGSVTKPLSGS